ncbi:MAG: transcription termination factor NusA [Dehalococcoidia bacterium]
MKSDLHIALTQLAAERHLPKETVLQVIEAALASAFKKEVNTAGQNITVKLDPNTGEMQVYLLKTVMEEVEDPRKELTLEEARRIKADAQVGETLTLETSLYQTSRIAAQTARQVVLQRLREAERELVFEEFAQRVEDIISGVVSQEDRATGNLILDLGRAEAILPPEEQVPMERFKRGERVKAYVLEVRRSAKGPEIVVSRTHKNLLKRLLELEVPEVYNGIVEIKVIAREPGARSKVAVATRQDNVDPVGSCIGPQGRRIQNVGKELQGEKVDVVRWDRNPAVFLAHALSPAEVVHTELNEGEKSAVVAVPDRQLSLAIGKEGQNARLAARLTGWRLDIKSVTEWEEYKAQRVTKKQAVAVEEPAPAVPEPVGAKQPVARKTKLMQRVEEKYQRSLEGLLPELVNEKGLLATAQELEVSKTTLSDWLRKLGITPTPPAAEAAPVEPSEPEAPAAPVEEIPASVEELARASEEELAALAVEVKEEPEEPEEEPVPVPLGDEIWNLPSMPVEAGKLRFAEDIMGERRGQRRGRKGRRGTAEEASRSKKAPRVEQSGTVEEPEEG